MSHFVPICPGLQSRCLTSARVLFGQPPISSFLPSWCPTFSLIAMGFFLDSYFVFIYVSLCVFVQKRIFNHPGFEPVVVSCPTWVLSLVLCNNSKLLTYSESSEETPGCSSHCSICTCLPRCFHLLMPPSFLAAAPSSLLICGFLLLIFPYTVRLACQCYKASLVHSVPRLVRSPPVAALLIIDAQQALPSPCYGTVQHRGLEVPRQYVLQPR